MITHDFPPSIEMGAQACGQIARYLPSYGWEPIVLTSSERYIERPDPGQAGAFSGPVIRTHVIPHPLSVYNWMRSRQGWPNYPTITRTNEDGDTGRSTGRRWALSLLELPDIHTGWIIPAVVAGLTVIRQSGVQHLLSSAPYWTNHLIGLALARLTGLPWTAHFRDPWTEEQGGKLVSTASTMVEMWLERKVMQRADTVVCVTQPHTAVLQRLYSDLPSRKFLTIPNGYDGAEWDDLENAGSDIRSNRRDTFVITYAGKLYYRRTPVPLFRALQRLVESGSGDPRGIRVDLVGPYDMVSGKSVRAQAAECGLGECVNLAGTLSRRESLRRMAESDLLLLLAEGLRIQIPGKTYEYLRSGKPILALTNEGAVADLLRMTGGAWVVNPTDDAGVLAAVREAYDGWTRGIVGSSADRKLVAAFDRRLLVGRFAQLFDQASARRAFDAC